MTTHETMNSTADREIVTSRLLNAPRELVFEAWTKPEHVAQWFGPNGFTNTIYEMEVKSGGIWRFMMHAPDGTDFSNKIVFEEVVKPEKLVYSHGTDGEDAPNGPYPFHVTVTFEAQEGNKTYLTMKSVFKSVAALEDVKKFGAVEGAKQTLNKLEEFLAKM